MSALPVLGILLLVVTLYALPHGRNHKATDFEAGGFLAAIGFLPVAAILGLVLSTVAAVRVSRERAAGFRAGYGLPVFGIALAWLALLAAISFVLIALPATIAMLWQFLLH